MAELDDPDGAVSVVDIEDEEAMIDDQHAQLVIAEFVFWREGTTPRHESKRFDTGREPSATTERR